MFRWQTFVQWALVTSGALAGAMYGFKLSHEYLPQTREVVISQHAAVPSFL